MSKNGFEKWLLFTYKKILEPKNNKPKSPTG
jgi:hypothetical protein